MGFLAIFAGEAYEEVCVGLDTEFVAVFYGSGDVFELHGFGYGSKYVGVSGFDSEFQCAASCLGHSFEGGAINSRIAHAAEREIEISGFVFL